MNGNDWNEIGDGMGKLQLAACWLQVQPPQMKIQNQADLRRSPANGKNVARAYWGFSWLPLPFAFHFSWLRAFCCLLPSCGWPGIHWICLWAWHLQTASGSSCIVGMWIFAWISLTKSPWTPACGLTYGASPTAPWNINVQGGVSPLLQTSHVRSHLEVCSSVWTWPWPVVRKSIGHNSGLPTKVVSSYKRPWIRQVWMCPLLPRMTSRKSPTCGLTATGLILFPVLFA